MRVRKKAWKILLIIVIILAATAFFSFLQYYLQVRITPISWKSKAYLILDDGTEYEKTIPVELTGVYNHYNVGGSGKVDSIEILATARDHEIEIFRGIAVYHFSGQYWHWAAHDREKTGYGHIDTQAMLTDYSKSNENASFLFYIDDVSKITEDGNPGQSGLLVVTKWETENAAGIVQSYVEETGSETAGFWKEYGLEQICQ